MDANYKLKVRIADHEFDGDGPADEVKGHFQDFKELVAMALSAAPRVAPGVPPLNDAGAIGGNGASGQPSLPLREAAATDAALAKIMKVDNRVVSLTLRAQSIEDAILLVLYGQKVLRQNDAVSGAEIVDGLKATGGLGVSRTDRLLERAGTDGDVLVSGERRAKRYRLTNTGITKARALAATLIATVA